MQPQVGAVVLTHRRPRLATDVVRSLLVDEGLPASCILLVVNGEGGLNDDSLEAQIQVLRLPQNVGPAGGWAAGFDAALQLLPEAQWIYVCEDDVGLFDLPCPRLARLVAAAEAGTPLGAAPLGAVVAFGRSLDSRTGLSHPVSPPPGKLTPVDVAAWGASLISRAVLEAGVRPAAELFFGYEDFDFWLAVRDAGFRVVVDGDASDATKSQVTDEGRRRTFAGSRPDDSVEPWRAYYQARNFLELRRRHGSVTWTLVHVVKSVRRMQLVGTAAGRRAILHGLIDGVRGRVGRNDRYLRRIGEL